MHPIAKAWSDNLRAAFRLQSIADKITEDDSLQAIQNIVSQDDRLSTEEKRALLRALPSSERLLTDSISTPPQLPNRSRPRAYLASISVEGFRGIGQRADLPLEPQPGLTLIYGANGSGKSTFVEALDVLLTGSTARFEGRGHEWRSAWANAHSPDRGQIEAEFVVDEEGQASLHDRLKCNWLVADLSAAAGEKDHSFCGPAQTLGRLDVAGAIDEFRPILGYGELGPLFEESSSFDDPDSDYVTPFAQHIRARASIRDETTDALWKFIRHRSRREALYTELSAWQSCVSEARKGRARRESPLQATLIGKTPTQSRLRSPADWNWKAFVSQYKDTETWFDEALKHKMHAIARAYLPRFSNHIRESIAQLAEANQWLRLEDGQAARSGMKEFLAYTPRVGSYAEMLLDEIHSARLEQFSQRVSNFWRRIRRSSNVRFEALSLQQHRPIDEEGSPAPELRVSLGLTIDGDRPIERGALSQGELHSLALSVFLPTLMRLESPFGFAVIDDPVQAMDEYAVDGLAEVLHDAAKELQVIVFTHDKRLPRALRLLDVEHTLINITRSPGSNVKCHVTRDPVLQALDDAQLTAEELLEDEDEDLWEAVGLHCRLAIEEAAIRTALRKMLRNDVSLSVVRDRLDDTVYSERLQARKLVALAIWGDAQRIGEVRDYVTERFEDVPINDTIDNLNGLVHGDEARVRQISDWYAGDPHRLVDDTKLVIAWLEQMEQSND